MDYFRLVTITGDVSSIIDNRSQLVNWTAEVAREIAEQKPDFAVVHVQGLGATQAAEQAARELHSQIIETAAIAEHFPTGKAFFDVKQTGLGCIYLIGGKTDNIQMISTRSHQPQTTKNTHEIGVGGCDTDELVNGRVFAEGAWDANNVSANGHSPNRMEHSEKVPSGYLLSQWMIYGKRLNLVNLNLYQQPQMLTGDVQKTNSSKCAEIRRQQLDTLLNWLDGEGTTKEATVLAGAFNAQLNEGDLMEDLANVQHASVEEIRANNGAPLRIEHRNNVGQHLLTVNCGVDTDSAPNQNGAAGSSPGGGSSRFDLHANHDWLFKLGRGQMVRKYNNAELTGKTLGGRLLEETIYFHPSRCFGYDRGEEYFLKNKCPAWADRILFNKSFSDCAKYDSFSASGLYYGLVGQQKDIGMFKPVALHATVSTHTRAPDKFDELIEFMRTLK